LPGDPDDKQARYVQAKVKGLIVASVYLPNGNPVPSPNFDYKLRWFERFIGQASELHASGDPVVLAGDLNVVPTDFDIYNPGWWRFDAVMQPEARDAYKRLLSQGWIDSARDLHPRERMYTYWVNEKAFREKRGMRLDFLLLSAPLQKRAVAAGVDSEYRGREKPSDHAPLWVSLQASAKIGRVDRTSRRIGARMHITVEWRCTSRGPPTAPAMPLVDSQPPIAGYFPNATVMV
jgi:exodeoxyribonuclease-3